MVENNNYLEQFVKTNNGVIYKYNDMKYGLILIKILIIFCKNGKMNKIYKR